MKIREKKYRKALEEIAALVNTTQTRGVFEHLTTPDQLMDEDGWGPIHPRTKDGLKYAAGIAQRALGSDEGADKEKEGEVDADEEG